MWHYGLTSFFKTKSPSTWNRTGKISKPELYHTPQQLSQYDLPMWYDSHKQQVYVRNKHYTDQS